MTVAAFALPIPKLMIVIFPAVAVGMGLSLPWTWTLCSFANRSTSCGNLGRRMYSPNFASGRPV